MLGGGRVKTAFWLGIKKRNLEMRKCFWVPFLVFWEVGLGGFWGLKAGTIVNVWGGVATVKLFDPEGREPDGRDPKYNNYKPIPLLSVGVPGPLRLKHATFGSFFDVNRLLRKNEAGN
jgi:hypothetical protein